MFYLVRHAKAVPRVLGVDHPQRPLTNKGLLQASQLARFFALIDPVPVAIYSSPFCRCVETATAIATQLDLAVCQVDWLRHGGDLNESLRQLQSLTADSHAPVILVGHEPELSQLVKRCTGQPCRVGLKKAGIAHLSRRAFGWQLQRLMTYQDVVATLEDSSTR